MAVKRPSGPQGSLIMGNANQFREDEPKFLLESVKTYGDLVYFRLANMHTYLVGHPDLIREVLVTQSDKFEKAPLDKTILGKFLGNGLLTSDGQFHRRQRRLAQPAFHSKRIQNYAGVMVDYANRIMDGWQDEAVMDITHEMMHLTMLIVSKTLFNADAITESGDTAETISSAMDDFQAVSNRDYVADFLYAASMLGLHLSRLSEQLILFSSQEFGFVRLDDAYSTGSSLMPQKKNPDTLELTRGKSGRLLGNLMGMLTTLKGLPSTYDKDLQEDKAPVFAATNTLLSILPVMAAALRTITVKPERMRGAIDSTMMATDLADYLVAKGVPFREAHSMAGRVVRAAGENQVRMEELPLEAYQAISPVFEADVYQVFDPLESINKRNTVGGTSLQSVKMQIAECKMQNSK